MLRWQGRIDWCVKKISVLSFNGKRIFSQKFSKIFDFKFFEYHLNHISEEELHNFNRKIREIILHVHFTKKWENSISKISEYAFIYLSLEESRFEQTTTQLKLYCESWIFFPIMNLPLSSQFSIFSSPPARIRFWVQS